MLKKMGRSSLLLALLLTTASAPLQSQTRPRRVTQTTASEPIEETAPRRRGRSWMRVLLGAGLSIGGRDNCTPSRERIGGRPRVRL
jgi:hypothetical protein